MVDGDKLGAALFAGMVLGAGVLVVGGAYDFCGECGVGEVPGQAVGLAVLGATIAVAAIALLLGRRASGTLGWLRRRGGSVIRGIELLAFVVTIWAAVVAKETFDDQRRLSAYQILSLDQAPAEAKWQAARTILTFDRGLHGLDTGCHGHDTRMLFDSADPWCAVVEDLDLKGDLILPTPDYQLGHIIANDTSFEGGTWSHFRIYDSKMTNDGFGLDRIEDFHFIRVDLSWARFHGLGPVSYTWAPQLPPAHPVDYEADISFYRSLLRGTWFEGDDWKMLSIVNSDLSGAEFFTSLVPDGSFADFNWYVRGDPPIVNQQPRPDLVDFVCDRALDPASEDPETSEFCHLTKAGVAIYGPNPDWGVDLED